MRRALVVALAVLIAAAVGVAFPAAAQAATHQVRIEDNVFTPKLLEIEPGDTVAWTAMRAQHTVTADDGRFDFHPGRTLETGEQVSWSFETNEVVRYHCKVHGGPDGQGMSGIVVVGEPPPPPVPDVPTLIVPDHVPTIAAAAAGAEPGTEVLVRPGRYAEEVVVTVPGLTIRGIGEAPDDVVIDGEHRRDVGVAVAAPDLHVENLTVTRFRRAGVVVDDASGTVVTGAVLEANGLFGLEARSPAGVTVRATRVSGHGVAGIGVRGCPRCGARIDDSWIEGNAAGVVAVDATGVVIRESRLTGNAVGVVLRDAAGAVVTGNTLASNAANEAWVASALDGAEPPNGAGIWVSGGRSNLLASNIVTGHTYNVAITGPAPTLNHRVEHNVLGDAIIADLGLDSVGTGVCFTDNQQAGGVEPTSDPPMVQTLHACSLPATATSPYPVVSSNLTLHARDAGYPV